MTQEDSELDSAFRQKKIAQLELELQKLRQVKCDEEYFRARSDETLHKRQSQMMNTKNQQFNTVGLWGLYEREDMRQFKSLTLPVFTTPTGAPFDSLIDGSLLLSYQTVNDPNKIYSRIDNTTIDHLAMKIAALEGLTIEEETQALCLSSGMAAIFMATMPFLDVGDNFLSTAQVYGGAEQLFNVTYPKMGWKPEWVYEPWLINAWQEKITQKTKFLYVETPSNPNLFIADIPALVKLAHDYNIPVIIDSTIASPALLRPLEYGVDIVIHSISKVMGSSGRAIGGAIVAKRRIFTNVPEYTDDFISKVKGGHFRNLGPCLHPSSAAAIWDDLSTLQLKVKMMSDSALKIANYLKDHHKIEKVNYPGLNTHPQHELAKRLMRFEDGSSGFSHLMSFNIRGGFEAAVNFARKFDFGVQVTDLGRNYTTWVHPASTTHGQMTPEMRNKCGIPDNLIRYSVGLEGADDAIKAINHTLNLI
jgi:O-acetylhomoserine (thiol)-lyase